jgi:glycosyltransferase involved in cell wall biosynthesis
LNILLTNSTDIFAGGEDYVLILARYLQQRGHRIWVSANPGHLLLEKCGRHGIPAVPVEFTGMGRVFAVGTTLRTVIRQHAIRIVHSNANYDRTAAAIGAVLTPARHVAGIHSAHSIQHNPTHWLRNRRGTAHFIADAEAVKEVLVREDGIDPARISVVPIGVESDPPDFRRKARERTRAALGVSPDILVIGNVARLVPFKGHRVLLDALAEVVRHRTDVLLPIVGDGELQPDLEARVRTLGLAPYVRFLGFRDNLNELYPAFDIYCHSSLELAAEAFPIAILRALASALPVVATNVGGIRLMVEEGISGYLTPSEQPAALAAAILRVMADPTHRTSMGAASFSLFNRQFHASAMAERVEHIYERVLA